VVLKTDRKSNELDSKVAECDVELRKIVQQLKNAPPSSRLTLQNKAKAILARKKRFEQQAESLREQSFNIGSLESSLSSANDMKVIAEVLKTGMKQMKKELKKIKLDEIEETQDEMADLIELTEDVQNAMAKNYAVPEDIDDEELDNQLELLGDEIVQDNDSSYMDEALKIPSVMPNGNGSSSHNDGGSTGTTAGNGSASCAVDEFGLPILNIGSDSNGPHNVNGEESNSKGRETKH